LEQQLRNRQDTLANFVTNQSDWGIPEEQLQVVRAEVAELQLQLQRARGSAV
jgi:ubiquinone biosynthesis protein UbiJ